MPDLSGYTTSQEFDRHAAASAADVEFYLAVMQAATARMQAPPPSDKAAMAYFQEWMASGTRAAQQSVALARAGNYVGAAQASKNALPRTAQVDLAQSLLAGEAANMEAKQRGMPEAQWSALANTVEDGAHPCRTPLPALNSARLAEAFDQWTMGCYGGDTTDAGLRGMSPAQLQSANARAAADIRAILTNRQAVAPYAARVRQAQVDYACAIPGGAARCKLARLMQKLGNQ